MDDVVLNEMCIMRCGAGIFMIISNVAFGSAFVLYNAWLPLLAKAHPDVSGPLPWVHPHLHVPGARPVYAMPVTCAWCLMVPNGGCRGCGCCVALLAG